MKIQSTFNPTTWEVRENFTETEFNNAVDLTCCNAPHGQLGVTQKSVKLQLPDSLRYRAARILRTREHEWTHFRQYISTPLGLFIYRLCAIREHATRWYYQNYSPGSSVTRRSFEHIYSSIGHIDEHNAPIVLWKTADAIEGLLWCKTFQLEDLIKMWNMMMEMPHFDILSGSMQQIRCRLVSRRAPTELAVPHGHIRVQDVTEGFAAYREARELILHYGEEEALRLLGPLPNGDNGRAARYIQAHLGVPFYHPLSGAIQEVAVLCFIDPFLSDFSETLDWDEIHPGLCLERAVQEIAGGAAFPDKSVNVYQLVLDAYGLTENRHRQSMLQKIDTLSAASPNDWIPLDQRDGGIVEELYDINTFQLSLFRTGLKLRSEYQDIFFNPQGYFPPAWNRFVRDLKPPLLIHPDGVSFPRAKDERSLIVNLTMLEHALSSTIVDDIARYGKLHEAKVLYRHLRSKAPELLKLLSDDRLSNFIITVLSNSYNPQVDTFH
jgi:hypothetical protein